LIIDDGELSKFLVLKIDPNITTTAQYDV